MMAICLCYFSYVCYISVIWWLYDGPMFVLFQLGTLYQCYMMAIWRLYVCVISARYVILMLYDGYIWRLYVCVISARYVTLMLYDGYMFVLFQLCMFISVIWWLYDGPMFVLLQLGTLYQCYMMAIWRLYACVISARYVILMLYDGYMIVICLCYFS